MVLIATSRKLDRKSVLTHPLGPLPWSLGNCDGTLKKTSKSTLVRQLEKNVSLAEAIRQLSTCIIDGMSLVQKVHGDNKTFAELSDDIFMSALCTGAESSRIDVVFDVYLDESIKNAERVNRGYSFQQHRRWPQSKAVEASFVLTQKQKQSHQVRGSRLAEAITQNEAL